MKFYIGANIFKIPDNKYANEIVTCGDDQFKEEIEVSDDDLQYYFLTDREELFLNSIEGVVAEAALPIIEQITEKIKSELKSEIERQLAWSK